MASGKVHDLLLVFCPEFVFVVAARREELPCGWAVVVGGAGCVGLRYVLYLTFAAPDGSVDFLECCFVSIC